MSRPIFKEVFDHYEKSKEEAIAFCWREDPLGNLS